MTYLTDPDFDEKMKDLSDFLDEQIRLLIPEVDEGPEEFSLEAIFDL